MTRVVLQPSASSVSMKHLADTIESPVRFSAVRSYLDSLDLEALQLAHPEGQAPMWGAKPGETNQHVPKWERIVPGDYVVFASNGRLFASAVVTHTFRNPDLALFLWGSSPTRNGIVQTWELMFALSDLRSIDVPYADINPLIGRKVNAIVQEFNVLTEDYSEALLEFLNFTDSSFAAQPDERSYESFVLSAEFGELERQVQRAQRLEQQFLRKALFPGTHGTCELCGRAFPIEFLTAAHIKRRAVCSDTEKRRFTDVAMANCRFGCDELFGKGLVSVDTTGSIVVSDLLSEGAARSHAIENIAGRRSSLWATNTGSREFFLYHFHHDFKVPQRSTG